MTKQQAEDFVYKSYLKASKYQSYHTKDSEKRRNDLTFDLLYEKSKTPCTVITGSKGKGSVANMISQILQSEYTVGLMTSPHIVDFCERFQVNSVKISDEDFIKNISLIQDEIDTLDSSIPKNVCISPMGIQAYLALNYFESCNTGFNIFECGKGAKFDDINNIKHDYAVINSIFLEHTRELGETLEEIVEDKSHVITGEQRCVYVAEQTPKVLEIIQNRANHLNVPLKIYGTDFYADNIQYTNEGMLFDIIIEGQVYPNILIPLLGEHQAKNCALAFALCRDILNNLDLNRIKNNLSKINWPGRMEVISNEPFTLLDACINSAACDNVIKVLDYLNLDFATIIVGIPDDKDYQGVVKAMEKKSSSIILTKSQNPHYIFTQNQQYELQKMGLKTFWTESVPEALCLAKEKNDPIVILGTTSVIAEVKKLYA
ncbi:MAG: bifunctional protein FolC [Lachnospiraceae bacterium]|nr:bifunctional protein FolC [Lachnospiraceae bacterium]